MASCTGKVYTTDIGTKITLDCGEDISTASVYRIYYQSPDGTTGYWTASVENDNYVTYTRSTSWDIAGVWKFQAYVEYAIGNVFYGETALYEIFPIYE